MIRITPILIKEVNKTGDPEKRGENLNKVFIEMRKTLLIITALMLVVGFSQQKKSDEPNPKKGIKTETILNYEYEEKFGELKEILERKTISKYDSNGNEIESSKYDSDGLLWRKEIYKYDSKNRTIEFIKYKYESRFGELQEIPTSKTTYEYVVY